jgi:hypothetical protein
MKRGALCGGVCGLAAALALTASVGQTTVAGASVDPVFQHAGLPAVGANSVTMFAGVARTLPTVTRASVLAAFSKLTNYSTDGLLPPLSFTKPGTALGGKAPRIINPTMGLSQYQNGTFALYAGGTFTDPFTVP